MKLLKTICAVAALLLVPVALITCGGSGGGGGGDNTGGVTTTITGTLVTSAIPLGAIIKAGGVIKSQTTDCTGYKAELINIDTKSEEIININPDCSFSKDVDSGETYSISFIDNGFQFIGTLMPDPDTGVSGIDGVSTGLLTSSSDSTPLGTVTLSLTDHTAIGSDVTSGMADPRFEASAVDGIPIGLMEGNGNKNDTNNMDFSTASPDSGAADDGKDPDSDNDGVLDIVDSDNDNDGLKDEIDGVGADGIDGGGCAPLDRMTLFTNNKVPATTIIAGLSNTADSYVVTIHMHPRTGYNVSAVSVSGPDYLSKTRAWFGQDMASVQWGWDGSLVWSDAEGGSYTAWISGVSESDATFQGISPLNLGQSMQEGDMHIFTVTTDTATYTCTKKINGVFREVPKNVSINGVSDAVETDAKWTSVDTTSGVTFIWNIDDMKALGWSGLDYYIELWPLTGDNCTAGTGQSYPSDSLSAPVACKRDISASYTDVVTLTIPAECLPGYPSTTMWQFDIAGSKNNNSAYQGGKFTSDASFPAGCPQ